MNRIRSNCPRVLSCAALVFMCVMPLRATGEPVFGEVFRIPQPDASPVDVRIWGDEFYQVVESLDGFTLTRDPASGILCYAQLSNDATALVSTGVSASYQAPQSLGLQPHIRIAPTASRSQARAARARFYSDTLTASAASGDSLRALSPTTGEVVGICLIVDFSDDPATGYDIPPGEVRAFCNDVGYTGFGNNGSVRDYYYDVSDGALTFTQFVPDAYYRAPADKLYYTDRSVPFGIRARELVLEALYALDDSGFAFDDYDANGDGVIDGISCLYAGPRHSPWGEGLWPHTWHLDFSADGVTTNKYAISDMYLDTGDVQYYLRLSTFCHEAGHMMFDWPDLYDYDFDSAGVGAYCIMAGHNNYTSHTNPQDPCAYLKYRAGWSATTTLTTPQFGIPVPVGVNTFYKYEHPTAANEYFLIENRQQLGRDVGLPDAGLAVWHIDTSGSNDDQQMTPDDHYEVTLVQADGQWDLETNTNNGDSTDLWSAPGYSALTPYTTPDTRWWDGRNSRLYLRDISTADPLMTFTFFTGEDCNNNSIPDEEDIASGTSSDCNTNAIPDECDIAEGFSLDCQPNGIPDECELLGNDCNSNAVPDECELPGNDCNTNGVLDVCDLNSGTSLDCQPNAIPDECELADNDCNTNGIPDECELAGNDCNSNTVPDDCELPGHDCNTNGILDECDIASGTSEDCQPNEQPDECELVGNDCNGNAIPDECELAGHDCNTNGILDECDISAGTSEDCQPNGVPDECELVGNDCDSNGIPDECELPGHDCNANGVLDVCDIATGASLDCQPNGIPDECELAGNDCNSNSVPDECELDGHDCNTNGILDECDLVAGTSEDCQPNGTPDECELVGNDCNGNAIPDECELDGHDCNANGTLDECDVSAGTSEDCQSNGVPDECELVGNDCDSNGVPDECDLPGHDCNANGTLDVCDIASGTSLDCQPNGIPDECELADNDCNTNGIPDDCELSGHDCNGNGILDECDIASGTSDDCQPNGTPDECELADNDCNGNTIPDECELAGHDCNANGVLDECDVSAGTSEDCQSNGVPDECELVGNDCDSNGVPDECDLPGHDCNTNGVLDVCDIASGASLDCQLNGIPDECELADNDCNANTVPDECELAGHDCNTNGVLDVCDIASGTSEDCQGNGVPDECELIDNDCDSNGVPDECDLPGNDCNANGILDVCDIASGFSEDCQPNGTPDECELGGNDCDGNGTPDECQLVDEDCNDNGTVDVCDLAAGTSEDCNANVVPDECDVASGTSLDCNLSGVPDECELAGNDCNANNVPDECELAGNDCNANGVLDECDIVLGTSLDCQGDGQPDECQLAGNDCNANGIPDDCEVEGNDCNSNGVPDECDVATGSSADCQENGVPDECELFGNDCNTNGIPDECELAGNDCNANGIVDECDVASGASSDCQSNGIPDECELEDNDCNGTLIPDECELGPGDCNANGIPDECDLAAGTSADCNNTNVPDECELAGNDCDSSGVPDECELAGNDCNGNFSLDICDIASGTSADCNSNGTPDECELAGNDCNGSSVPDDCELEGNDCNHNGTPDECDVASGESHDDNANGVPDECEPDPCVSTRATRVTAPDASAEDWFGHAVAVADGVLVVGAEQDDDYGDRSGSAHVFRYDGADWVPEAKLLPSAIDATDDLFGGAVAVSAQRVLVGAYNDDFNNRTGTAYLFEFENGNWSETTRLLPVDGDKYELFGAAVTLTGNIAVVGAQHGAPLGRYSGATYVYRFNGVAWIPEAKLVASDGSPFDYFGVSVAGLDDTIVVGANGDDDNGTSAGCAYVFRYDGANWIEEQKLLTSNGAQGDGFGISVAISGSDIIVGAYRADARGVDSGAAYVFEFDGTNWVETQELLPADLGPGDFYGYSVAMAGDGVIIGADKDDDAGMDAGAAYVFQRSGTTWLEKATLLPFGGTAEDSFGRAVAIDESGIGVAGAHGYDGSGSRSGAAFVFYGLTADCNSNYAIDLCDITLGTSADDDGDGIPDECAVADPADFDQDGDVDLDDHRSFVDCAADPDRTPTPTHSTSTKCLEVFDSDDDTDVDLYDFAAFQRLFR